MEDELRPLFQEVRDGNPESIMIAHQIVADELGDNFYLIYGGLPKNVGVIGDVGVYGDTVMICAHKRRPLRKLLKNPQKLEQVSSRLSNESYAITKVLIETSLLAKRTSLRQRGRRLLKLFSST